MMSLVLFAFGVRFILYSFLTNAWWVLPIEILQGITYGMFYPTMTSYANVVSLPGTETTVQVNTYHNISTGILNLASLYEDHHHRSYRTMYSLCYYSLYSFKRSELTVQCAEILPVQKQLVIAVDIDFKLILITLQYCKEKKTH